MLRPLDVKPLPDYRLWLRYSDGTEGVVDLSDLAGKGVFENWQRPGAFERVSIGSGGEIVWESGTDLCPDMLYMRLSGKRPEQVFTNLNETRANA